MQTTNAQRRKGAVISFRDNSFANPLKLIDLIQKSAGTMKVRPDQKLVLLRDLEDKKDRVTQVTRLLTKLAELAKSAKPDTSAGLPPPSPVLVKKPMKPVSKPFGARR